MLWGVAAALCAHSHTPHDHRSAEVVGGSRRWETVCDSARERMCCVDRVLVCVVGGRACLSTYTVGRRFLLVVRHGSSVFVRHKCPLSMGNHGGSNPHAVCLARKLMNYTWESN